MEQNLIREIKKAIYTIRIFVGMRVEDGVYEFPSDCLELLRKNIDFLDDIMKRNVCDGELKHSVCTMIEHGNDVYNSSTTLEINKL